MKTKSTGRVALRDEEINAVRKEVEAESDSRHRLTDMEAFGLAESVKEWQYHGPDARNTSLVGSYVGSVKIDDIEVTVRLMKDRYVSEFCEVEYAYTMTAAVPIATARILRLFMQSHPFSLPISYRPGMP